MNHVLAHSTAAPALPPGEHISGWLCIFPRIPSLFGFLLTLLCASVAWTGEDLDERQLVQTRVFYINGQTGQDRNPGTTETAAWQSLRPLMLAHLRPGDRILLTGGQTFTGPLRLTASGTAEARIFLDSSNTIPATIDAGGGDGITLENCAYLTVRNLHIRGSGRTAGNGGSGVSLLHTQAVTLDNLEVQGFRLSGINTSGDNNTRITRVLAHHNGFAGISVTSDYEGMPPTTDLYIGRTQAWDNAGDPQNRTNHSGNGIVIGGVRGGLVEYCSAWNNGYDMPRKGNGPVGIWAWQSDRVIIQHCVSHDNKTSPGSTDGGGFDLDGGVTNSILQYNLSYRNQGAGYLLCQYPGAKPWKNNRCRFNISWQDGAVNTQSGIALWAGAPDIEGAQIYNNTIAGAAHALFSREAIPGVSVRNNILCATEEVVSGPFSGTEFRNNWYWSQNGKPVFRLLDAAGTPLSGPAPNLDATGMYGQPALTFPADAPELPVDPQNIAKLLFFRPAAGSPLQNAGQSIPDPGSTDMSGRALPEPGALHLGAIQP